MKIVSKPENSRVALWGLIVAILTAAIYFLQLRSMQDSVDLSRRAMKIDQRAWLSPDVQNTFSLDGPDIPANIYISNTGRTPATHIIGHVIGTTFTKGEHPAFDEYGIGHPHTNIYTGAIYPGQKPLQVPLKIVLYSNNAGEQPRSIIPTPELARQIQNKETFVILFGEVRYCDVFGVQHWVKFCNGSGDALGLDGIKECIYYNRTDNDETPTPSCQYQIPPN